MIIKKPWGEERILLKTDAYVVKALYIRADCRLSLQYHEKKRETLFLVSGNGYIETNHIDRKIDKFYADNISVERINPVILEPIYIDCGTIHRIGAGRGGAIFLEVSTTELEDVVRLEDDYGR